MRAQPWLWLYDADLLCVEDPDSHTLGYCSVMGRAGEHYALGVYLGDPGFFGFCQMLHSGEKMSAHEALQQQDCIMCSFEDRDQLQAKERKLIKDLGLAFRGKNAWPMFRRYEPGYYPWDITAEEGVFLIHALRQIRILAEDIRAGQVKIDPEQGKTILRYSTLEAGVLQWHNKPFPLAVPTLEYVPLIVRDELLTAKIKQARSLKDNVLQADFSFMPTPVQDNKNERPYFPRLFLCADKVSGQILAYEMYQGRHEDAKVAMDEIIKLCLQQGRPAAIQVRDDALAAILDDFCQKTGIMLKRVKRLTEIDRFLREMPDFSEF